MSPTVYVGSGCRGRAEMKREHAQARRTIDAEATTDVEVTDADDRGVRLDVRIRGRVRRDDHPWIETAVRFAGTVPFGQRIRFAHPKGWCEVQVELPRGRDAVDLAREQDAVEPGRHRILVKGFYGEMPAAGAATEAPFVERTFATLEDHSFGGVARPVRAERDPAAFGSLVVSDREALHVKGTVRTAEQGTVSV